MPAIAKKKKKSPTLKSKDLPATQGMVLKLQAQVKADLRSLEKKTEAQFKQVDARFKLVDARFDQVDARLSQVESQIAAVLSEVHRIALMMEEQNSRNRYVLEGYDQVYQRQERLEKEVENRLQAVEQVIAAKS